MVCSVITGAAVYLFGPYMMKIFASGDSGQMIEYGVEVFEDFRLVLSAVKLNLFIPEYLTGAGRRPGTNAWRRI